MELYKKHISDLGRIVTGKTPRTSIAENYGGSIPFLTPSDELSYKYAPSTGKCLTELGLSEVKNCLLPAGSVCVSCIGSDLGKVVITKEPTVTNQQFNSIVPNKDNDANFIYYLMKIVGKHLNNLSKTSTAVPIINKSTFSSYEIEIPELKDQKEIALILSSIDDKIDVNKRINDNLTILMLVTAIVIHWLLKRINDNLEQQAQALFEAWFVDFEPFKDCEFVESELGMIPNGWKIGCIFDVANIYDKVRKPLSGQEREKMEKKYPYYGATSCMDFVDDFLFDGIYTLIGEDGSVIKEDGLPYMQYVWGKFWVNNHAHILQGKNGYSTEMIHVLLSSTNIAHLVTGAVQAKLSQANMQKILLPIPSKDVLDKFRPVIDELYTMRRKNEDESRRLAQLRDSLLPRLMSGELKASEINA